MGTNGHTFLCEDYVSFETTKLLKEKGFDGECSCFYDNFDYGTPGLEVDGRLYYKNSALDDEEYAAPTLQMAMKWLREVHNKIIVPGISLDDRTSGTINHYIVGIWYIPENNGGAFCYTSPTPYEGYPSFEEACESGIRYCLENIV